MPVERFGIFDPHTPASSLNFGRIPVHFIQGPVGPRANDVFITKILVWINSFIPYLSRIDDPLGYR